MLCNELLRCVICEGGIIGEGVLLSILWKSMLFEFHMILYYFCNLKKQTDFNEIIMYLTPFHSLSNPV